MHEAAEDFHPKPLNPKPFVEACGVEEEHALAGQYQGLPASNPICLNMGGCQNYGPFFWGTLNIRIIGAILGFYGDNGKENGNYYIGDIYPIGPFLGTLNIRCRIIIGIPNGTIILTTTHMSL